MIFVKFKCVEKKSVETQSSIKYSAVFRAVPVQEKSNQNPFVTIPEAEIRLDSMQRKFWDVLDPGKDYEVNITELITEESISSYGKNTY